MFGIGHDWLIQSFWNETNYLTRRYKGSNNYVMPLLSQKKNFIYRKQSIPDSDEHFNSDNSLVFITYITIVNVADFAHQV